MPGARKRGEPPAPIVRSALRLARSPGTNPGDSVQVTVDADVRCETELDGEQYVGQMALRRTYHFAVLERSAVKLRGITVELLRETMRRGAEVDAHLEECGHPQGCGRPCRWCGEMRALSGAAERIARELRSKAEQLARLRARAAMLLQAAALGDAEKCQELMEELGEP